MQIASPADSAAYLSPASITVNASASDAEGSIAKVEFFDGATLVGSATQPPYSTTIANAALGTHALTAKATDNLGVATTPAPVNVVVTQAAAVAITAPAGNATFPAPSDVVVTASASDPDGTVAQVEFYNGATLVATVSLAPYTFTWTGVSAGQYTLIAKVTDNAGASMASAPVTFTVGTAAQAYYIMPDHLDTPRVIEDKSQNLVWSWDNTEPFGDSAPNDDPYNTGNHFDFPLRISLYRSDPEIGIAYANQRDTYDPSIGRFPQSDPIGLMGGLNTYSYVNADPGRPGPVQLTLCVYRCKSGTISRIIPTGILGCPATAQPRPDDLIVPNI